MSNVLMYFAPPRILDQVGLAVAPSSHVLSLLASLENTGGGMKGSPASSKGSRGLLSDTLADAKQQAAGSCTTLAPQPFAPLRSGFGSAIHLECLPGSNPVSRGHLTTMDREVGGESDSEGQVRLDLYEVLVSGSSNAQGRATDQVVGSVARSSSTASIRDDSSGRTRGPTSPAATSVRRHQSADSASWGNQPGGPMVIPFGTESTGGRPGQRSSMNLAGPASASPPRPAGGSRLLAAPSPPSASPSWSKFNSGPNSLAQLASMDRSYSIRRGSTGRNSGGDEGAFGLLRPGQPPELPEGEGSGAEDDSVDSESDEGAGPCRGDWSEDEEDWSAAANLRWHEVQAMPVRDPVTGKEVGESAEGAHLHDSLCSLCGLGGLFPRFYAESTPAHACDNII